MLILVPGATRGGRRNAFEASAVARNSVKRIFRDAQWDCDFRSLFGFLTTGTAAVAKLKSLYVYHEEPGVWGYFKSNVTVTGGAVKVVLSPLKLSVKDSLRHFHKSGKLKDGQGVRVGVIDSGADLDATGSGVGVVSTFPGEGYGPLSGTSMASPAVAGVAARLLAAKPGILGMARDAARSDAIRVRNRIRRWSGTIRYQVHPGGLTASTIL